MYKIIYCSDLHGNKELYNKLFEKAQNKEIRAVVIGGDICPHFHGPIEMGVKVQREFVTDYLIPKIKNLGKEVFIMMGNDDFAVNMDILRDADENGLLKLLHNKLNKIGKYNIIGYSFVPSMPFLLKDWEKLDNKASKQLTDPELDIRTIKKERGTIEEDFKRIERLSNPNETIYVIHSPPYGTGLDMISNGEHVGSKAIKEFINKEQPPLTLHGHVHESPEVSGEFMEKIKDTICINPGSEHLHNKLRLVVIDIDNLNKIKLEGD